MSEQARHPASPIDIPDSEALRALLYAHGFHTEAWGVGPTKTVDALWQELDEGEAEIVEVGGELVRRIHVAAVEVIVELPDGPKLKLYEEKQVFKNGSQRERHLITSLGEKIKPEEDTEQAVRRAIAEELGIMTLLSIETAGEATMEKSSQTYGGMMSQLLLRLAQVKINPADYNPDGYIEHQADKSVYFKWAPIES